MSETQLPGQATRLHLQQHSIPGCYWLALILPILLPALVYTSQFDLFHSVGNSRFGIIAASLFCLLLGVNIVVLNSITRRWLKLIESAGFEDMTPVRAGSFINKISLTYVGYTLLVAIPIAIYGAIFPIAVRIHSEISK